MSYTNEEEELINLKRWVMRVLIFLVLIAGVTGGCSYFNRYCGVEDNNTIEEFLEGVAESYLHLPSGSIDATPGSPE